MNEVQTTKKLLAITALIFVAATLISLPYQNQVANAAPTKRYQIIVTLTNVPPNTGDLIMNVSIRGPSNAFFDFETVSSPSSGDVVKFVIRVPAESNENSVRVCSNTADFTLSWCDSPPLSNGPIRVNHTPRPPI